MPSELDMEATIDVAAPPEKVWDLVTDLRRIAEWSPNVVKTLSKRHIKQGSIAVNLNRQGWKIWTTTSKIVRYEPVREIAFKVLENRSVWSFALEPTETGTRLTQRREVANGLTKFSSVMTDVALGGRQSFDAELFEGMNQTLARIKAEAEGS